MDYIKEIKKGNEAILVELYKLYRDEFLNWSFLNYSITKEDGKDIIEMKINVVIITIRFIKVFFYF